MTTKPFARTGWAQGPKVSRPDSVGGLQRFQYRRLPGRNRTTTLPGYTLVYLVVDSACDWRRSRKCVRGNLLIKSAFARGLKLLSYSHSTANVKMTWYFNPARIGRR